MSIYHKKSSGVGFLINAASFVIVMTGIRFASPIIVPFLLSVFIAFICSAPLFWLKDKGVPTVIAISIIIIGIIIISLLMGILAGGSIDKFSLALPSYQAGLHEQTTGLITWLGEKGFNISAQRVLEHFDPGKIMQLSAKLFSGLGGILTNTFMILLTVFFILLEASSFSKKLRIILKDTKTSLANFDKIAGSIKYYLAIKTLTGVATGVLVAAWLTVQGVDFPILWGLLAFLFNYVPNIGSIIAAIPAVLLALIQFGIVSCLLSLLGYVLINIIIGSIIEPRIMGRRVGLSTLIVFLSLVFWGWILGLVGMLLSVPLTIILKIALENNDNTRWIAVLLGSEESANLPD